MRTPVLFNTKFAVAGRSVPRTPRRCSQDAHGLPAHSRSRLRSGTLRWLASSELAERGAISRVSYLAERR